MTMTSRSALVSKSKHVMCAGDRVVWHKIRPPLHGEVLRVEDRVTLFYVVELDNPPERQAKVVTLIGSALRLEASGA